MSELVKDYVCPECKSTKCRFLECEDHKRDCQLIICCDCGTTAEPNI